MEKREFHSNQIIFREINSSVTSLVEQLISRNFCHKSVRENFRNFHTVLLKQDAKYYVKSNDDSFFNATTLISRKIGKSSESNANLVRQKCTNGFFFFKKKIH